MDMKKYLGLIAIVGIGAAFTFWPTSAQENYKPVEVKNGVKSEVFAQPEELPAEPVVDDEPVVAPEPETPTSEPTEPAPQPTEPAPEPTPEPAPVEQPKPTHNNVVAPGNGGTEKPDKPVMAI